MRQLQTYPLSVSNYYHVKKAVENFITRYRNDGVINYSQINAEIMRASALLVLCEAATEYKPNKSISFERYAYTRVRNVLEEWT